MPESALAAGFANDPIGSHTSRTMMLAELRLLLATSDRTSDMNRDGYRRAVIDDNVLHKRTLVTRKANFRFLRELYALDPEVMVFQALRNLWAADSEAQPLLASMCAVARDPLLRATAVEILDAAPGAEITPAAMVEAVERAFPGRYRPNIISRIGRNTLASWRQSGHVAAAPSRARTLALNRPTATAYVLLLGHLCGARGDLLFETLWARLLDQPVHSLREMAATASRQGLIEYRHAGGVTEVSFRQLLSRSDP